MRYLLILQQQELFQIILRQWFGLVYCPTESALWDVGDAAAPINTSVRACQCLVLLSAGQNW